MNKYKLAKNWIEYGLTGNDDLFWAIENMYDIAKKPDVLWDMLIIITELVEKNVSDKEWKEHLLSSLAAGPFEDFLKSYGQEYLPQIKLYVNKSDSFKFMSSIVYKEAIGEELWDKLFD